MTQAPSRPTEVSVLGVLGLVEGGAMIVAAVASHSRVSSYCRPEWIRCEPTSWWIVLAVFGPLLGLLGLGLLGGSQPIRVATLVLSVGAIGLGLYGVATTPTWLLVNPHVLVAVGVTTTVLLSTRDAVDYFAPIDYRAAEPST